LEEVGVEMEASVGAGDDVQVNAWYRRRKFRGVWHGVSNGIVSRQQAARPAVETPEMAVKPFQG
jgi:hypothetical protein